jgi:uncharacterized protein
MKRIYLDANIFLNAILYDDEKSATAKRFLSDVVLGKIEGFTSCLTWDEVVFTVRKLIDKEASLVESKRFLNMPNIKLIIVDEILLKKAQDMMEKYNLKPRDAIHIASAIISGCDEIVSDDSDFDKVKELKRMKI